MNPIIRTAACLVLALPCIAGAAPTTAVASTTPLPRDSLYQAPVRLTAQDGVAFDWRTRRGKPQLVSMFYSSCPYICPLIIDAGKAIERALPPAERARLGILLISIDPARDTPAALSALMAKRGLGARTWTLASPAAADVRQVAGLLGVRYRALAGGDFNHTSVLVLLDAQGRIVARSETIGSVPDPEFVAAVRRQTAPRVASAGSAR